METPREISTAAAAVSSTAATTNTEHIATGKAAVLVGSSQVESATISAARQIKPKVKKSVFLIDNLSSDCSVTDLVDFVSRIPVEVITCFEAKSRRRYGDSPNHLILDRKAFRLCVNSEDQAMLLDPVKWPDSVTISAWVHKPKETVEREKRMRYDDESALRTFSSPAVNRDGPASNQSEAVDMDATVIDTSHQLDGCVPDSVTAVKTLFNNNN